MRIIVKRGICQPVSKQLHRNVQENETDSFREKCGCQNRLEKHKQRLRGKESEYRRPALSNSTYTAAFSDAWNAAFRSAVCMHVWVIWRFTQTRGVTCRNALAVYTTHELSACIYKQVIIGKVPRLRESRK